MSRFSGDTLLKGTLAKGHMKWKKLIWNRAFLPVQIILDDWSAGDLHIRDFKIGGFSLPQTSRCHVTSRLPSDLTSAVHVSTSRPGARGKSFTAGFSCYLTIAKPRLKPTKSFFLPLRTIISDLCGSSANFHGEFWHLIKVVGVGWKQIWCRAQPKWTTFFLLDFPTIMVYISFWKQSTHTLLMLYMVLSSFRWSRSNSQICKFANAHEF